MNGTKAFMIVTLLVACGFVTVCSVPQKEQPIILSKGLCLGTCPQFNVTIYADGTLKFEGQTYTKVKGNVVKQLSGREKTALLKAFDKIDLSSLHDAYDQSLHDVPEVVLRYGDKQVRFKRYNSVPAEVKTFVNMVDDMLVQKGLL